MKFFTPVFAAFVAIAFADDDGDDQDTKDKITSKAGDAVSDVKSGASAATSKAASAAGGDGDDKDNKSSSSGAGAGTLGMAVGAVGLAGALLLESSSPIVSLFMPQLASRHIEILMNQLSEDYVRCSPDGNGGTACTKIESAKESPCVFAKPEVQWAAIGFFVVLLLVQMVRAKCQCRQRRDEKAGEV